MLQPPSAAMSSSTLRVLMPSTYASWTTANRAQSMRRRGSSRGEEAARAQLGDLVLRTRSRWPLRYVVRVDARSWGPAPIWTAASASMSRRMACSRTRRRTSGSAPSRWSSSAWCVILGWAVVGLLGWVRASRRTPRWPSLSTSSGRSKGHPRICTKLRDIIHGVANNTGSP